MPDLRTVLREIIVVRGQQLDLPMVTWSLHFPPILPLPHYCPFTLSPRSYRLSSTAAEFRFHPERDSRARIVRSVSSPVSCFFSGSRYTTVRYAFLISKIV